MAIHSLANRLLQYGVFAEGKALNIAANAGFPAGGMVGRFAEGIDDLRYGLNDLRYVIDVGWVQEERRRPTFI